MADLEEEVCQMEAQIQHDRSTQETKSKGYQEARRLLQEAQQQFKTVDDQIQEISEQVDPLKVSKVYPIVDPGLLVRPSSSHSCILHASL